MDADEVNTAAMRAKTMRICNLRERGAVFEWMGIVWVHIRAVTVGFKMMGPRGEVIRAEGDTEPALLSCAVTSNSLQKKQRSRVHGKTRQSLQVK